MVTTEERRVELARQASGLVELEEQLRAMRAQLRDEGEAINRRHKQEWAKLREHERATIGPLRAKVQRASSAMSEIRANYVPRELVTAVSNASATVSRLKRTVQGHQAQVNDAKSLIKARGSRAGDHLKRALDSAESQLAEETVRLNEALSDWEAKREELDKALAQALRVE